MENRKQPSKAKTTTVGGTILAIVLAIAYAFMNGGNKSATSPAPDKPAQVQSIPTPAVLRPDASEQASVKIPEFVNTKIGFASRRGLEEHFEKHGGEFGEITLDQYLLRAQTLRDTPAVVSILEAKRADGVITRFDKRSGAFLAINPDKTIRTFFRPNDGERYFKRQAEREGDQP